MDTHTVVLILGLVGAVALVAALLVLRRSRSDRLRARFGPEYALAVEAGGDRRKADIELHKREKRVAAFEMQPLTPGDRDRFIAAWGRAQAEFVDSPQDAVVHADELLGKLMTTRGYPLSGFEQQAADLSVDHPVVVQNYRAAHAIAVRHARGEASTEDLRQAIVHFRALFEDLVTEPSRVRGAAA